MSQVSRIPFHWQPLAAGLAATLLASCGGGGGSPTPSPPPPSNSAPQFTSGNTATVAENSTGTVYTATASDADGDTLTFSIAGGADAAAFTLSGGALSFASAPNFDAFADTNNDNVYTVNLQVSDGRGRTATRTVDVTVTNDREGIRVTRIATGFTDPVGMDRSPESQGLVIAERDGTVWDVKGNTGVKRELAPIPLGPGLEVIDIAFGQASSALPGRVVMVRSSGGISLFRPDTTVAIDADIAGGAPAGAGGSIWFGVDGRLYAAVGDPDGSRSEGSSGYGHLFWGPGPNSGASLRPIPMVFIGRGVRQPGGGMSLDADYWFADQGGSSEHEITKFDPNSTTARFGWPFIEGTVEKQTGAPAGLRAPELVYPFGTGSLAGEGIIAGAFYLGSNTSLSQKLVFGDTSGKIWSVAAASLRNLAVDRANVIENRTADFEPDIGSIDRIVEIVKDNAGTVYILDADGELFRVDAS